MCENLDKMSNRELRHAAMAHAYACRNLAGKPGLSEEEQLATILFVASNLSNAQRIVQELTNRAASKVLKKASSEKRVEIVEVDIKSEMEDLDSWLEGVLVEFESMAEAETDEEGGNGL